MTKEQAQKETFEAIENTYPEAVQLTDKAIKEACFKGKLECELNIMAQAYRIKGHINLDTDCISYLAILYKYRGFNFYIERGGDNRILRVVIKWY